MKRLTSDILLRNKFDEKIDPAHLNNKYKKYIDGVGKEFYEITITHNMANMEGRNWLCQIENRVFDVIASIDIDTVGQFNQLMKLMNINFKIK